MGEVEYKVWYIVQNYDSSFILKFIKNLEIIYSLVKWKKSLRYTISLKYYPVSSEWNNISLFTPIESTLDCLTIGSVENGSWYTSCVHTRFGIYLFKLYSGPNIYINRIAWKIRNVLNRIVKYIPLNIELILEMKIEIGIYVYSCFSFEYGDSVFGLYIHNKVNSFIYNDFALTIISSYACNRCKLIKLARICSCVSYIDFFGVKLDNIKAVMKLDCGLKGTLSDTVARFSKFNKCVVDIQCIITQWLW